MLAGAEPAIASGRAATSHPRAFGRTSNVWQYLDSIQDRRTPPAASVSRVSGRRRGDAPLEPLGDAASDGDDDWNDDESRSSASHDGRPGSGASQRSSGSRRRRESDKRQADGNDRRRHVSTSSMRHSVTFADGNNGASSSSSSSHNRQSSSSLQNVVSLPELLAIGHTGGKKSSLQAAAGGGGNIGAPIWRRDRKPSGDKAKVNVSEVMRTLHALGTSASAPVLPAAAPVLAPSPTMSALQLQTAQAASGDDGSPTAAAAAASMPAAATATIATTTTAVAGASDAEKLRNDFNSQRTRLSYGCSVALELFNGHVMMVSSPDGQVRVQSLEVLQAQPPVKGYRDRAVFTLLDLSDPRSASSIRFGDAVWLQLSVGTGDVSWEQGGVLGAQVREAPQLKALALSAGPSLFRHEAPAPAVVGHPVPIRAYLPKSRDDGDMQMDEIQSRVRNKASKMLGKWVVRSAVHASRKQPDNFVYNHDEIYLEQDWFYLGADSDAGVAVLRQLPSALSSRAPGGGSSDVKDGEYVLERRGAWRVRLLDSSNGGAGLSLAQQQMERLLLRAKTQLKQSRKMRAGHTRVYAPGVHGGAGFPRQLRGQVGAAVAQCDAAYLAGQQTRLETLSGHLNAKARAMDVDVHVRAPRATAVSRRTSGSLTSGREGGGDATVEATPVSSRPSSGCGSGRRRSAPKAEDVGRGREGGACEGGCGLCHSSTLGVNLCSQLHHVMQRLRDEAKEQARSCVASLDGEGEGEDEDAGGQGERGEEEGEGACRDVAEGLDGGVPSAGDTGRGSSACDVAQQDPLVEAPTQEERLRRLLAAEDAALMGIILFKEKEAREALAAEEQARIGLSPTAAHLRDRFKHVGVLAQAHHLHTHAPQHGIGGHFQRLHAELSAEAAQTRKRHDEEAAPATSAPAMDVAAMDMATCPFNYPPEGFDVFGRKVESDSEAEDDGAARHTRLFPTEDELDLLAPIDTAKVLGLYSQNWGAVLDMLEGFGQLVDAHVVPGVGEAVATRSRGALVEMLDFVARASEFVCAVRVQVRVAQLLHAISASEAGDFEGFAPELQLLVEELEATSAFVKFFRERNAQAKRKKRANR